MVLQPYGESGPQGQSLACDLQTGKLMFADNVDIMQAGFTTVYGIMGIAKLQTGSVLVAVTGAKKVRNVMLISSCIRISSCPAMHVCPAIALVAHCQQLLSLGFACKAYMLNVAGSHTQRSVCLPSHRHQDVRQAPYQQQRRRQVSLLMLPIQVCTHSHSAYLLSPMHV